MQQASKALWRKVGTLLSDVRKGMTIVLGAGVAGASCAFALARQGAHVRVVESNAMSSWRIGETLGAGVRPVLQSLGVWDEYVAGGHLPCHGNASAWGADALVEKEFIFNPHGNAWQLDRIALERMLVGAAEKAGAVIQRGQAIGNVERTGAEWRVRIGSDTIAAKWLIDATGHRAFVARKMGVKRFILDQLVAIYGVATSLSGTDNDSRTYIESCSDGWWYSALMPGGRRTVSFQTDADLLAGQGWRTKEWFAMRLRQTRHIARLMAGHRYEFKQAPQITSAHSGRLKQFRGDGWLAIGDAAMSFDPLSGQGILKAMQSGLKAAELVVTNSMNDGVFFEAWNEDRWLQFSHGRSRHYAAEQRWVDSVFWARRIPSGQLHAADSR